MVPNRNNSPFEKLVLDEPAKIWTVLVFSHSLSLSEVKFSDTGFHHGGVFEQLVT